METVKEKAKAKAKRLAKDRIIINASKVTVKQPSKDQKEDIARSKVLLSS